MPGFPDDQADPDPAALDELSRAFGDRDADSSNDSGGESPRTGAEGADAAPDAQEATAAATPTWLDDEFGASERADEPTDIVIIEQDPLPDPTPAPPPTIIRIDDYSGSRVIEPVSLPGVEAPDPDAPDPEAPDPDRPDAVVVSPGDAVDTPPMGARSDVVASHEVDDPSPAGSRASDDDSASGEPMVISIDDADLPDAVYVEGSLDRDSSRSIILIEDDDTGDAVRPEAERDLRRGIEPRLRERRVAVKRAAGRKRLKWVILASLVVLVVVGVLATLGSPLFAVREDQVSVTGNVYTDPEQLQAVIDDLVGTPVLRVDTQAAEEQLEAIPWVDTARVRTEFPHAVTIEIDERAALTTYQGPDGRYRVLDRHGRVLDVLVNYPFAYLLIGGEDAQDLEAGQFAPVGYAAASELAKNLTPTIRGQIAFVEVRADGSQLDLLLDNGTRIKFGEARDFFAKLIRVEAILANTELDGTEVIDVSTNEVTK